jgi:hypothetical protein
MMGRSLLICLIVLGAFDTVALAQQPTATGKNGQSVTAAPTPATAARSAQPEENCGCESQVLPEVLATVNGIRITNKELDPATKDRVAQLQRQVIEARKRELDLQINSKLLQAESKKRGLTPTKLLEADVLAQAKEPTEAEAQAFYDQNKDRIRREFKDTKTDIVGYLRDQRQREEAKKLAERLRTAAQIKILVQNVVPPQTPAERTRVLATVNNEPITSADVEDSLRPLIFNVQEQVYNLRKRELDLRINDVLLEQEAQKRKMTTSALLDAEVSAKVKQVTEEDARAFYEQNKEKVSGDFAERKEQIIRYLQERELRNTQLAFADQLRRNASIQMLLIQPKTPMTADPASQGNSLPPR